MLILELDTKLPFPKYKGKTVQEVIQFNFNYVLYHIKENSNILVKDDTLDFLIKWSRGLGNGKTYIGDKEEAELREVMKMRWARNELELEQANNLYETWCNNRDIDKDNEQAFEP